MYAIKHVDLQLEYKYIISFACYLTETVDTIYVTTLSWWSVVKGLRACNGCEKGIVAVALHSIVKK